MRLKKGQCTPQARCSDIPDHVFALPCELLHPVSGECGFGTRLAPRQALALLPAHITRDQTSQQDGAGDDESEAGYFIAVRFLTRSAVR